MIIVVEAGALSDGTVHYRWTCARCGVKGVWLRLLVDAERNAAIHRRAQHSDRAVA